MKFIFVVSDYVLGVLMILMFFCKLLDIFIKVLIIIIVCNFSQVIEVVCECILCGVVWDLVMKVIMIGYFIFLIIDLFGVELQVEVMKGKIIFQFIMMLWYDVIMK